MGKLGHLVYGAVKADRVDDLPGETKCMALAMKEHAHLPGVHNALEFADVRDGEPHEIDVDGEPLNPLAHISLHAAVLEMVQNNKEAEAAFRALVGEGINRHHAVHILGGLVGGFLWVRARKAKGLDASDDTGLLQGDIEQALARIQRDGDYRAQLIGTFTAAHWEHVTDE